jgi:hypothetical protein
MTFPYYPNYFKIFLLIFKNIILSIGREQSTTNYNNVR